MADDHAYDAYVVASQRILAALADLDQVMPGFLAPETHAGQCWRVHTGCLAARIRATLTGEDPTDATPDH